MALEKLVNKKISAAQPNRRAEKTGTAQYIRYIYIMYEPMYVQNSKFTMDLKVLMAYDVLNPTLNCILLHNTQVNYCKAIWTCVICQ